jgi:tRNA pseudouridine38-40 synthase
VGSGRLPGERMTSLRDEAVRVNEFKVMPAAGLTLTEIGYPPDDELQERADRTRARRESPLQ